MRPEMTLASRAQRARMESIRLVLESKEIVQDSRERIEQVRAAKSQLQVVLQASRSIRRTR